MIVPFLLFLGTLGYLCFNSRNEIIPNEYEKINLEKDKIKDDDIFKDLDDLFI